MRLTKFLNRYRFIIILGIVAYAFSYFGGLIGIIIAIPVAIFIHMGIRSLQGVRYWNTCKKEYDSMIANNYPKERALLGISKKSHPELSENTHTEIVRKFNDIHFLVNFITGALPNGILEDEFVLKILKDTTIQHYNSGRYKVTTKRTKKNLTSSKENKIDKFQYLKSRKNWGSLGENVLKQIADTFDNVGEKKFIEFVILSEHYKMLEGNYLKLSEIETDISSLIWLIAGTIHRKGTQIMEQYNKSNDTDYLKAAISCYTITFILNKNFLAGYFSLSCALVLSGEFEEAKNCLDTGEKLYFELKKAPEKLNCYEKAMLDMIGLSFIEELKKSLLRQKSPSEGLYETLKRLG